MLFEKVQRSGTFSAHCCPFGFIIAQVFSRHFIQGAYDEKDIFSFDPFSLMPGGFFRHPGG
jgi:hypothetical protein